MYVCVCVWGGGGGHCHPFTPSGANTSVSEKGASTTYALNVKYTRDGTVHSTSSTARSSRGSCSAACVAAADRARDLDPAWTFDVALLRRGPPFLASFPFTAFGCSTACVDTIAL
jgi:hypothetical protein